MTIILLSPYAAKVKLLFNLFHTNAFFKSEWEAHLIKCDLTEDTILRMADHVICAKLNDFWTWLPDSGILHSPTNRPTFFALCDLCEGS